MTNELIQIDLHENEIWCFESSKDILTVNNLRRAIRNGEKLPPIEILVSDEDFYLWGMKELEWDEQSRDGGHHRIIAHYLEKIPISAILKEKKDLDKGLLSYRWNKSSYAVKKISKDMSVQESLYFYKCAVCEKYRSNMTELEKYYLDIVSGTKVSRGTIDPLSQGFLLSIIKEEAGDFHNE